MEDDSQLPLGNADFEGEARAEGTVWGRSSACRVPGREGVHSVHKELAGAHGEKEVEELGGNMARAWGGELAKTSIRSLSGNARLHRRRRGRPQSLDSDLAAFWNSREVVSWWEILEVGEEWEANEKHWVEWVAEKGAS